MLECFQRMKRKIDLNSMEYLLLKQNILRNFLTIVAFYKNQEVMVYDYTHVKNISISEVGNERNILIQNSTKLMLLFK